jgi:hypothetical protein
MPVNQRLLTERGTVIIDDNGKQQGRRLNVRQNKQLLTTPDAVARLVELEMTLSKDPAAAARAGHLQIVARKRSRDASEQAMQNRQSTTGQ